MGGFHANELPMHNPGPGLLDVLSFEGLSVKGLKGLRVEGLGVCLLSFGS